MITMQNSWGTQGFVGESKNVIQHSSKDEFETGSMVDMSGNKNDNTDFGLMMERSISAPPPSGMGFDFEKESFLLGNIGGASRAKPQHRTSADNFHLISDTWQNNNEPNTTGLSLFDNLKRNDSHTQESLISDVLLQDLPNKSRNQPPTSVSFGGQTVSQYGQDNMNHIGSLIDRPQSAAPNMSRRHAPPGLEQDFSSTSTLNMFHSEDVMKIGVRRPASTGVIGQVNTSTSVMETLGLMPTVDNQQRVSLENNTGTKKTFMDLIQEDFVKTPSPEFNEKFGHVHTDQPNNIHRTKPLPHTMNYSQPKGIPSANNRADHSYYQNHHQQSKEKRESIDDISHEIQNTSLGINNSNKPDHSYHQFNKKLHSGQEPHVEQHAKTHQMYSPKMNQLPNDSMPQRSGVSLPYPPHQVIYNPTPPVHVEMSSVPNNGHMPPHHNPHIIPQQASYEQQPVYYAAQQYNGAPGADVSMAAPQVYPSQTSTTPVYMSATPFGYATVQYHTGPLPHHLSNQMLHSHNPTMISQTQHSPEFVPPIPVPPGQITEVSQNAPYVYWQQPSNIAHHGTTPTFTIVNSHGQATTIAVAPSAAPSQPTNPQSPTLVSRTVKSKNGMSTRSKSPGEKGSSKTKKNGNASMRRNGMDNTTISDTGKNSTPNSSGSSLLEDFRCAKNRSWTIMDIQDHIVEFCQDQNGSRFIQQRLEVAKLSEKELVMAEVLPSVRRLRNDVFGNYVVQKLLENGSESMREELKSTLQGEMLSLSMQMYGCRVVQKALETLGDEKIPRLLEEFHGNVMTCIHDQNGNHVIQKCVEVLSSKAKSALKIKDDQKAKIFSDQIQFIIDNVLENIAPLSCHPYGCRVLQRILEHCVESQKLRTLDEIMKVHRTLLDDQYGNYVIQHVLQYGRVSDRDSILEIVTENGLLNLSRQKYASNVVEKLLKFGTTKQRNVIVREMLMKVDKDEDVEEGTAVVLLMVRDAYANYVVQTSLDVVVEGEERRLLLEELNKNANQLRNFTFAKHIVTKLGH